MYMIITAIVPGAIYTFVTWQSSTEALSRSIGMSFEDSAKESANNISNKLSSIVDDAEVLGEELDHEIEEGEIDLHNDESENGADLSDQKGNSLKKILPFLITARNKKYSRLTLTNQSGAVVSATPSKKEYEQYAKQSWWQETITQKNRDIFIGNLHFNPDFDKYLIIVSVPIRDSPIDQPAVKKSEKAPTTGVLIMDLTLDRLFGDIVKKKVGNDIKLNIVDSNRNLILNEGSFMKSKVTRSLYKAIAQPTPTWKVVNNEEKTMALIGTAPIIFEKQFKSDIFSGRKHWYVMAQQPLFDAYAPVIDLMKKIFVLGWGAVLVIFLLGYFGAGQIIKPLKKLKSGAREIGEGNLDIHLNLESGDEIQDLAEEFNHMAIALKGSQQKLRAVNEQLSNASKLKSEFLASMSHELRTPLNSIIGFAEVMADQLFGPLNPKQQKYMSNIHTSGHHLLQLINDILDLSKIEAGKLELNYREFSANEVLNDTLTSVAPLAEKKNLDMKVEIDSKLASIAADESKFKQIMYNLLSNAVKFTPDHGKITVKAVANRKLAVVTVTDTGIGISEEDQEIIFQQFRQVSDSDDREFEGTGLGLALTKKLVEMHGGRIWLKSEPGRGSSFSFSIPFEMPQDLLDAEDITRVCRLPEWPAAPKNDARKPLAPQIQVAGINKDSSKPTILVVEDDPKAAELLSIYLRDADYEVVLTVDGEEALALAPKIKPFAITLDIMLPTKDGWAILQELQASPITRDIPVIICSMVDDSSLGLTMGAVGHITKPIRREELITTLTKCRQNTRVDKPYVVLVVDDDPQAIELVRSILEPEGFGILKANDGEEAINIALDCHPDLIVLDLMMPKVSGFDVIQALNESTTGCDIPIIVLTAKELTLQDRQHLNRNIDLIMRKAEFKKEDLIHEIHKLERLDPHRAMLIDAETGLYNYRYFKKRLLEEEARSERYKRAFSVVLIKITNLDQLNPQSSDHDGMSIMKDLSRILETNIRGADPVARYSEDQFAIVLPETTKAGALRVARKISNILNNYQALAADTLEPARLEASISAAAFFEDSKNSDNLISLLEAGLTKPNEITQSLNMED